MHDHENKLKIEVCTYMFPIPPNLLTTTTSTTTTTSSQKQKEQEPSKFKVFFTIGIFYFTVERSKIC